MGAQPGPQEGPEALHGVDVNLMEAVTILITGVFTTPVTYCLMVISPVGQTRIDMVLVGEDAGSGFDALGDDRFDGDLPDILQHT